MEKSDNIKVMVRVRPLSNKEIKEGAKLCVSFEQYNSNNILLDCVPEQKSFSFDWVGGLETTQEDIFTHVGLPLVKTCLEGYNCTVFAYGQTGAGKTYTMQGRGFEGKDDRDSEERGLQPRVFDYIYSRAKQDMTDGECEHLLKASYFEIYNEQIVDLLNPLAGNLQVREDLKRGVFIDGISEETTTSAEEAIEILNKGARNRHVGATEMNNESSRSHSVFTLTIESKRIIEGVTNVKSSKFHFVDLAGSERQKQTASVGTRLKEAGNINKSLTVLGSVINALVDISSGKKTHIRYRDSKLTFLLKDSLGGNSKTAMIANVSPASINFSETLSTLKFAQRAKLIKNKASINEELTGSIDVLRKEITRLKRDLQAAQSGNYGGSTLSNGDPMSSNFNGQSSSIMPETIERVQKELVEHNSLQLDLETMLQETVSLIDSSQAIADSEKLKTEKIKAIHEQASSIGERREKQLRMMVELYEEKIRRLGYGAWSEVEEKDATARENRHLSEIARDCPSVMQVFSENIQLNELIMDYSASSSSHHNHEKYNENLGAALKKTMSLIQESVTQRRVLHAKFQKLCVWRAMTLDEIMKAEQSAEVMKVELEAKLDQATKINNEYRASNDDLRYRLSESERQVTQLSIAEARIKENHKTEIARLMRRSNNMQTSPGKSNEGDDAENNVETLKMIINRLETDLESKSASLKAALEDSELKTQHLKAQLLEITGKNQSMEIAEGNLRAEMDRLSETVDLMAAEASTMREKQVILQMERDKSVHALDEKSNDFLKLESKADTERARLREEIEKVFEEAAAAFEEKKGIQEEMETLQASNRYYQKELDEKNLQLAEQLSKIQSMEQLLLQFEGVNGSENVSAGETIKDLNRKVELRMAENKRLESELTEAKQRAIIKDNEKCQLIQAMHDLKVEAQRLSQSVVEKNSVLKSKEQEIDELLNELRCKEGECSKLRANIDSQAQEKTQTGSSDNRRLVERVDQYEGILKEKVAQVHKANERYNDLSMKYVAIEEDYKSCKERHARETRDMQARINSLKQYNEKLLQLKDSHENELDDLKKTSEGRITQLEERVEDLQTMADALEEQMKLDGGNKAELANSMSSLRRSLQERKDARGDPIALQQEIKKLRLDYNGKLKMSKKQLVSLDATLRECKAQVKKLNDSILSFSKHLAANRESLKGKEHQIEKLKSEVSVEITHKETVVHENRQLKHQIESILAQANQQRSEYAASGRQIQTLKQSVIERENRIADLLSDTSNSKDRMIVQYRDLTTKHENQINDLQSQVKNNQSIIDSLSGRLTEVTKVDGQAADTQVRNVIDSDLIVAWISDMQKALKSMFDMPEVKLMNTSQFKEITSRLVDYIRRISERESMVAKNEAFLKQQIMRIKNMESQIEFLISEARASKAYTASNPLQPSIMTSSGHPTFNSGMYRSGMQTPRHAMMAEQSIKMPDQRRSMIPSAARTRRQSPPSNRDEHIFIPAKLMQPRQGGLENIPKQIKRPPQIHQYQKPPMIDLRDDSDNLKLGKRMVVNGDVENIDEESPQQYRASHKLVKR